MISTLYFKIMKDSGNKTTFNKVQPGTISDLIHIFTEYIRVITILKKTASCFRLCIRLNQCRFGRHNGNCNQGNHNI